jgi:phenylacetate-CoA ligase
MSCGRCNSSDCAGPCATTIVAHYHQAFDAAGYATTSRLEDLARFRVLTKQDFRANYPVRLVRGAAAKIARIHASSGTTGKPTVVGYGDGYR